MQGASFSKERVENPDSLAVPINKKKWTDTHWTFLFCFWYNVNVCECYSLLFFLFISQHEWTWPCSGRNTIHFPISPKSSAIRHSQQLETSDSDSGKAKHSYITASPAYNNYIPKIRFVCEPVLFYLQFKEFVNLYKQSWLIKILGK